MKNRVFIFNVFVITFASAVGFSQDPLYQGNENIPKNVILMISDGCGYNQVDAASLYQYGKTGTQIYEKFPYRVTVFNYSAHKNFR